MVGPDNMARRERQHEFAIIASALAQRIAEAEAAVNKYLDDGLMPLERLATDEELLADWQAMTPQVAAQMISQSPRKFLAYWKDMEKLTARQPLAPPNPLEPYLSPYGLPLSPEGQL